MILTTTYHSKKGLNMENLLILDTETTGLDAKTGQIIEIGAVLYNVPTRCVIQQMSSLFTATENPAFEVNRISLDALQSSFFFNEQGAIFMLMGLIQGCDAIVAHNAQFDREWIELKTHEKVIELSKSKKWICTKEDFDWPVRAGTPLNLIHIAVDLGVPVVTAHRALADCQLLAECFSKLSDLPERLAESVQPKSLYLADVSFDNRQLAKDAGFSWNSKTRWWERKMTQKKFEELKSTCQFRISELR